MSDTTRNLVFIVSLVVCCNGVLAADTPSFFKSRNFFTLSRQHHRRMQQLDRPTSESWLPWTMPRGGEISSSSSVETVDKVGKEEFEKTVDGDDKAASGVQDEDKKENISLIFAATREGDGSESDPDGLPSRFLRMQKGNREKAKAAFIATVKWRDEYFVNSILDRPYSKYDVLKRIFPVYIPGRDSSNNIVVVQRPGLIDYELGHKNNVTGDDLLMHYVYICEYCWNILEPGPPEGVMTTVMDCKNIYFSTYTDPEQRYFLKKFVKMMSDHYPQRSYKTLIINAPSWANMAFKLVKPLLRETTKKKITILNGGKEQDKVLIEILGRDAVPKELLQDPSSLEDEEESDGVISKIDQEMRLFCTNQLERHSVMMQQIVEIDEQ